MDSPPAVRSWAILARPRAIPTVTVSTLFRNYYFEPNDIHNALILRYLYLP